LRLRVGLIHPDLFMDEEYIDLKQNRFTIGMPAYGHIPVLTATSLINTFRYFDTEGIDLSYCVEINCSIIDFARNNVIHQFLSLPADKLICIDSDMTWEPEALARLCAWSTKFPLVAAMYSTKMEGDQKFLGDYYIDPTNRGLTTNEYGLVRMVGLGMGFCIIDRSVFETMMPETEYYTDKRYGKVYRFFQTTTQDGVPIGEDIYFFRRWCNQFNGEVWVDPTITLGHVGSKTYTGDVLKSLSAYHYKLLEG
jgi:hypothetical protein